MYRFTFIDYMYFALLIWNFVKPLLVEYGSIIGLSLLSKFIDIHDIDIVTGDEATLYFHLSLFKLSTSNANAPYPLGLVTILKKDNAFALLIIKPVSRHKETNIRNSVRASRLIGIPSHIKKLRDEIDGKNKVKPKGLINITEITIDMNEDDEDNRKVVRRLALVNEPGSGCCNKTWDSLIKLHDKFNASIHSNLERGLPIGMMILLIGSPGSGKSTMAKHLAAYSNGHCMYKVSGNFTKFKTFSASLSNPAPLIDYVLNKDSTKFIAKVKATGICLIDDIDRFIDKDNEREVLAFIDKMIERPVVIIFTANSINKMGPATLSRMNIIYIDPPSKDSLPTQIASMINIDDADLIKEWVEEIGDEIKDLRELRNAILYMNTDRDLPDAWRRMKLSKDSSLDKAKEDGDKYL